MDLNNLVKEGRIYELKLSELNSLSHHKCIDLKIVLANACALAERNLIHFDLYQKKVDIIEKSYGNRFRNVFNKQKDLENKDIKTLLVALKMIHATVAHYNVSKDVYIYHSANLLSKLNENAVYDITKDNALTYYGALCLCSMFLSKFQIMNINMDISSIEWLRRKKIVKFQGECDILKARALFYKNMTKYSLNKSELYEKKGEVSKNAFDTNSYTRRHLGAIFLYFDYLIDGDSYNNKLTDSIYFVNDKEVAYALIELRNVWFHGYYLNDNIKNGVYSIKYIADVLYKVKCIIKYHSEFRTVVDLINEFSDKMIYYKLMRGYAYTFKLFDTELYLESHNNKRVGKLNKISILPYEMFGDDALASLKKISDHDVSFEYDNNEFFYKNRNFNLKNFRRIELYSKNDLIINGFQIVGNTVNIFDITQCAFKSPIKTVDINGHNLIDILNSLDNPTSFITDVAINLDEIICN